MRAFLIRRNSISLAICGIAAVLMFYVVNYPAAVDASASARQLPIYCVPVSYAHLTLPTIA